MRSSILAGSFLAGLALIATPVHAQRVSADVVLRSGPVAGHVVVGAGHPTYAYRRVIVERRVPVRRIVVVERVSPRVIVVERFRGRGWKHVKQWKRHYRPVTVFYLDGRYYDRVDRYHPGLREVVVYEHDGRFYRAD